MKKIILCLAVITLAAGQGFSQRAKPGEFNGKVIYSSAANGTITVTSTGFGKKSPASMNDASAGAIYTLLFRGVAGSPYNSPMVPDENDKKNHPTIKALLDGGYSAFITENVLIGEEVKNKKTDGVKGKMSTYRITVNCDALRRHLEQNGAIRKFCI